MSVQQNHQVQPSSGGLQDLHHQQGPTAAAEWIIFSVGASFAVAIFFLVVFATGLI